MKQMIRNLWFNYRSEVFFAIVLFVLGMAFYFIVFWYVPNRMFTRAFLRETGVKPSEWKG